MKLYGVVKKSTGEVLGRVLVPDKGVLQLMIDIILENPKEVELREFNFSEKDIIIQVTMRVKDRYIYSKPKKIEESIVFIPTLRSLFDADTTVVGIKIMRV